jgi:valacyclovir hydrolase
MDREKFTLIAWDPPGYGLSRPPERDFSGDYLRRDAKYAAKLMQVFIILLVFFSSYSKF